MQLINDRHGFRGCTFHSRGVGEADTGPDASISRNGREVG